jgi:hypothetical protein
MCGSKHHDRHLCSQQSSGELLASNTMRVECGHCGGRSESPGNVCDPIALPTIGWFGDCSDFLD